MAIRQDIGALFTDLYEVAMAQAYWTQRMSGTAVFETFFRKLPPGRSYVMAAGLADVTDYLESFRFDDQDLDYLRGLGQFSDEFLRWLAGVCFTGDVWAVPEGTVVFPNEPIVAVIAPIIEAQLVETFVLNQIHLQSVLASKAARVVGAARGRPVVDFGARRAHGADAALKVARTSYLAGAAGTSNLLAARHYGIPAFGTMAHSYVQAFDNESDAFDTFARLYPGTTLLVDTYDTLRGVDRVIELARRLGDRFDVRAVRLDSGDLGALSTAVRARLDAAGLHQVEIFASSGLDEHRIAALVAAACPIDGFGVGTKLVVAADAPALDMAYKLVEYGGIGRTKLSSGKVIYPGRKQVFRTLEHGRFHGDMLGRHDEKLPGEPLLAPVMSNGRRLAQHVSDLAAARNRARQQTDALPPELRSLEDTGYTYPVVVSDAVVGELERIRHSGAAMPGPPR
ncbi:nicotinate phosphoribosyltransferase family protein [Mycobacterium kansasii 732]|uniref:Nicotinate phosphoribosyltransferase n=1 Tax=Mycobacterium pseudokansasii TaxID=2341080 RepID=A0A498QNP1_9MYCO|nr:nicotinate phosphoribosyltransferase [Mycobacterium pseudokansasii]EUA15383.1 nicotinate phosphoribosyltransferase family protein [Mycobacterium kansasii 732]KZS62532.1 nicotinate phosphoribosyltransferase [Mycobacterium kansasii]MBY0389876.1 nicotinate phosphoribosyltransferase [Mycobacterium pseudokansasii]VAZ89553.1 Nicotinate phosphoribosyltransferase pncB2 [Mycobacterium pseudokansasii]VAZ90287.1 Nicotinate phosphoribosyltransferase pncB2 [Mycobacterium pseudokansasii]